MTIQVYTNYNRQTLRQEQRLTFRRKRGIFLLICGLLILLGVGLLLLEKNGQYFFGIFILVLGIVMPLFLYLMEHMAKKQLDQDKSIDDDLVTMTFTFSEENITIQSQLKLASSENTLAYDMLYEVCETEDYFYLYRNKNTLYSVDKAHFITGDTNELRNLLRTRAKHYKSYV